MISINIGICFHEIMLIAVNAAAAFAAVGFLNEDIKYLPQCVLSPISCNYVFSTDFNSRN